MGAYIDKKTIIKFIDDTLLHEDKLQSAEKEVLLALKNRIEILPGADVRPVKSMVWLRFNWGVTFYHCSECGYEHRWPQLFNYCPNCGAKTKGVEDD